MPHQSGTPTCVPTVRNTQIFIMITSAMCVEVKVRYGTRIIIATWHTVSHVMSATTILILNLILQTTDSNEVTKKIVGQKLAYVDFLSYYCRMFGGLPSKES